MSKRKGSRTLTCTGAPQTTDELKKVSHLHGLDIRDDLDQAASCRLDDHAITQIITHMGIDLPELLAQLPVAHGAVLLEIPPDTGHKTQGPVRDVGGQATNLDTQVTTGQIVTKDRHGHPLVLQSQKTSCVITQRIILANNHDPLVLQTDLSPLHRVDDRLQLDVRALRPGEKDPDVRMSDQTPEVGVIVIIIGFRREKIVRPTDVRQNPEVGKLAGSGNTVSITHSGSCRRGNAIGSGGNDLVSILTQVASHMPGLLPSQTGMRLTTVTKNRDLQHALPPRKWATKPVYRLTVCHASKNERELTYQKNIL